MNNTASRPVISLNSKPLRVLERLPFRRKPKAEAAKNDLIASQGKKPLLCLPVPSRRHREMSFAAAEPAPAVAEGSAAHPIDLDADDHEPERQELVRHEPVRHNPNNFEPNNFEPNNQVPDRREPDRFEPNDDPIVLDPIVLDGDDPQPDPKDACTRAILDLFPDMCHEFLRTTSEHYAYNYEAIVGYILDKQDTGMAYPRQPQPSTSSASERKRKRQSDGGSPNNDGAAKQPRREAGLSEPRLDNDDNDDNDENDVDAEASDGGDLARTLAQTEAEAVRKCPGGAGHHAKTTASRKLCCRVFQQAFPYITQKTVYRLLDEYHDCLLRALLAFDAQIANRVPENLQLQLKRTKTELAPDLARDQLDGLITRSAEPARNVLEEYRMALTIRDLRRAHRTAKQQRKQAEQQREEAEQANLVQAQLDGATQECQCCFDEFAMNRMVHCDGGVLHWFCRDCARRMAETQLGLSKHQLACMSTDGCQAGFARDQQRQFLDRKARAALERLEMENSVRLAGLENLETCPFCPFAAEYPPPEVDKEFRCQRPACGAVSCRLCRKPTHIPKTCAEALQDMASSARLSVEEAMSEAMIRKCNKCGTPFIKEAGCNKMMCSRPGCRNVQCYVCHKSCTYAHFDDKARGGKAGNCPLFENADRRHDSEVRSAEERAIRAAAEKNPDVNPAALKISMSEAVLADEQRRLQRAAY